MKAGAVAKATASGGGGPEVDAWETFLGSVLNMRSLGRGQLLGVALWAFVPEIGCERPGIVEAFLVARKNREKKAREEFKTLRDKELARRKKAGQSSRKSVFFGPAGTAPPVEEDLNTEELMDELAKIDCDFLYATSDEENVHVAKAEWKKIQTGDKNPKIRVVSEELMLKSGWKKIQEQSDVVGRAVFQTIKAGSGAKGMIGTKGAVIASML